MSRQARLAVLAGLASAGLFISFAVAPWAILVGLLFSSLPLFLAGLALGTHAVITASAFGTVFVVVIPVVLSGAEFGGLDIGLMYLLLAAAAPVMMTWRALLSHPADDGTRAWYPLGRLMVWLAGLAAVLFLLNVVGASTGDGNIIASMEQFLVQVLEGARKTAPPAQILLFDQVNVPLMARVVLALQPIMWMVFMIGNAVAAQALLSQAGRSLRPKLDYRDIKVPRPLLLAAGAAVILALVPGDAGWIALTLAAIFMFPYFLLGLTVVHSLTDPIPARKIALTLIYVVMLVRLWPVILITGLGVIEDWAGLRRRADAAPAGKEEE